MTACARRARSFLAFCLFTASLAVTPHAGAVPHTGPNHPAASWPGPEKKHNLSWYTQVIYITVVLNKTVRVIQFITAVAHAQVSACPEEECVQV